MSNAKVETMTQARDFIHNDIIESFSDEHGTAWAYYKDGKKKRLSPVESEAFKDWVRVGIDELAEQPKEAWVDPLVKLFASMARRNQQKKLYLRWANIDGGQWYFHLNDQEHLVITSIGGIFKVEAEPLFRSFTHQKELTVNEQATIQDLDRLDKYLRFKTREERELFKTTLPCYFIPGINKPIVFSRGPPGSGKTTFHRVFLKIVDPSITMEEGMPFPKKDDDWFSSCREHQVLFIDNVTQLKHYQQDQACTFITGMSVKKRKLYTDFESVSAKLKGILLINGIDPTGLKSDFIDRGLIWELDRIPDEERMEEGAFWAEFEKDLPHIRGALFKILSEARKHKNKLQNPPELRLADFAKWSTACALARGIKEEDWRNSLLLKSDEQSDETFQQSLLTAPLVKFMEDKVSWEGSATELKRYLEEQEFGTITGEPGHEITVVRNVPKDWFQTAQGLGKEVSRLAHLFPRLGFKYQKERSKHSRKIILEKCETYVTHVTPTSRSSETTENKGLSDDICSENKENHMSHMSPLNKEKVTGDKRVTCEEESYVTPETSENEDLKPSDEKVTCMTLNSEKIPMEDLEE